MTTGFQQVTVRPGDVVAGKYRVERVLGVGGMGVVVQAHHLQLDERVALKVLLHGALTDTEAVSRFGREARAAAKIKSEHVARVIDVGQLENGTPYIVTEYLDGIDLAEWLRQRGKLAIDQAVDFVLQACDAVAEAHSIGIIHRDLKPANLFCIRRRDHRLSIKVLDFGISKVASAPGNVTRTHTLIASPIYMSPEQMQSSMGVDERTDIWSLGVVLFELVTGRAPFLAKSVTEAAVKVVTEPAPPVRSLRGDAPPALDQVISRCLQKDRNFRFANIAELAVMLRELGSPSARDSVERILHTRGACATVRILPPEAAGVPHAFVQPCAPTAVSQCGGTGANREPARTSGVVIGVSTGVLFLCVALGGGALLFSKRGAHAAATADSTSTGSSAAAATAAPPETTATAAAVGTALAPPPEPVAAPPDTAAAAVTASATTKPPAATARPVAKPNCNPPYYFDAKGSRIFKKECL